MVFDEIEPFSVEVAQSGDLLLLDSVNNNNKFLSCCLKNAHKVGPLVSQVKQTTWFPWHRMPQISLLESGFIEKALEEMRKSPELDLVSLIESRTYNNWGRTADTSLLIFLGVEIKRGYNV